MPREFQIYGERAGLYAAAFDWDCTEQARAIVRGCRLPVRRVVEPMCGHGRLLKHFGELGKSLVGIDGSTAMIELARINLDAYPNQLVCGDVINVVLDEKCELAVCPINSIAYLNPEELAAHLETMSHNLQGGASYWFQLDLRTPEKVPAPASESWQFEFDDESVQIEWFGESSDGEWETQVSRFRFADGSVFTEPHLMKIWTWDAFAGLVEASRFEQIAAYDNDLLPLSVDDALQDTPLTWHQLLLP